MAELALVDKAFSNIMTRLVETGQAQHYTELAADLGLTLEEARQTLHDLIATGIPAWLHPDIDYLVSFPPFNSMGSPINTGSPCAANRNGSPNEGSNRWRSAGCFPERLYVSIARVWITVRQSR